MAYQKCKWLDISGRARFTKNDVARCAWPIPDAVFPVSITIHNDPRNLNRSWVGKADCEKCPCFEVDQHDQTDARP